MIKKTNHAQFKKKNHASNLFGADTKIQRWPGGCDKNRKSVCDIESPEKRLLEKGSEHMEKLVCVSDDERREYYKPTKVKSVLFGTQGSESF